MNGREDYKSFVIHAEALEVGNLWTWRCRVETLGEFIPEGPEIHRSANSAFLSGIAHGKKRVDDFLK
jgi:hypothetical protein